MLKVESAPGKAIHIHQFEDEHRELFRLHGDLQCAIAGGASTAQMLPIVSDLVAHTNQHFLHEEREMRAVRYDHYVWHLRQHKAARAKVTRLGQRIRRGDGEAARELLEFLHGWLKDHIGIADRMLGAYLRNYYRSQEARAS